MCSDLICLSFVHAHVSEFFLGNGGSWTCLAYPCLYPNSGIIGVQVANNAGWELFFWELFLGRNVWLDLRTKNATVHQR